MMGASVGVDACKGGGDGFYGGLIVGAEPADDAVVFFFGAFGIEGDEIFMARGSF